MKKPNFFDGIRKSISAFVKQTSNNITEFARETFERVTPRRKTTRVIETEQPRIEEPRKPAVLSAEGIEVNTNTRADVQAAEKSLSGSRKAKDIARELGITTQKWVSIRNKIRAGDLYGEGLLERLGDVKENLTNAFEQLVEVEYTYTNPDGTHETRTGTVVYFPNNDRLNAKVPYGRKIKLLHTFSDAKNYWGQIGGGAEYFGIVNVGNGEYQIVDLRNQTEYNNRGKMNGEIRAQKILKNLQHGRIANEDE